MNAEAYLRKLYFAARGVADDMRNRVDHYTFEGSMNDVEDLRELLDQVQGDPELSRVVYK